MRRQASIGWVTGVVCGFLLLVAPVQGTTVAGFCAPNGVYLSVVITSRFDGPGSGPADAATNNNNAVALTDPPPPYAAAAANAVLAPASSTEPKDTAQGTVQLDFEFGSPFGSVANDTLKFDASGTVSAVGAKNSAGNDASAVVDAKGTALFYLDPLVCPLPMPGTLELPGLRPLQPFENYFKVDVYEDLTHVASLTAGGAGASVPLFVGKQYQTIMQYQAEAPHGTDPPFSIGYVVGIQPNPDLVGPEPSSLAVFAVGLWGLRRRRKCEGPRL